MKTLTHALLIALLPVLLLATWWPERLLQTPEVPEALYSVPGADVVAFTSTSCPHCRAFKRFAQQQGWEVEYHNLATVSGRDQFTRLRQQVPQLAWATPTLIIDYKIFQGYDTDLTSGASLQQRLSGCQQAAAGCRSFHTLIDGGDQHAIRLAPVRGSETTTIATQDLPYQLQVPLLGRVDLSQLSLPVLSVLLGLLDGFNPCAMWVLITLLTLLLALNDHRKMLLIGGTFLLVSGLMYYFFIAAWLNVFLLIGYNFWLQKMIGLVAVGAGGFYFYEAFGKDPNVCQVTDFQQRQNIKARMKRVIAFSSLPLMLFGITLLAISVNLIELVCTAGLPAIFTQILANNPISDLARYGYLLLYILMYMLDDSLLFLIAIFSLQASGMTTRYRRLSLILGGSLIYSLGLLMIFAPELLML